MPCSKKNKGRIMIKIAICDDETIFLEEVHECCKRYFDKKDIECIISVYSEGNELLNADAYDIVLLDVEMPGVNGIDIKNYIEKQRQSTRIVFISGYPEAMSDAFGDNVSGFLVKPLDEIKFEKKMDEVLDKIMRDNRFILCDTGEENIKVYIKDILYIKAEGRYSQIYKNGTGSLFVTKSISEYENEAGNELVRCHKSFIVNLEYVKAVKGAVKLKDGTEIPIGRTLKNKVKEKYDRYILRRM